MHKGIFVQLNRIVISYVQFKHLDIGDMFSVIVSAYSMQYGMIRKWLTHWACMGIVSYHRMDIKNVEDKKYQFWQDDMY